MEVHLKGEFDDARAKLSLISSQPEFSYAPPEINHISHTSFKCLHHPALTRTEFGEERRCASQQRSPLSWGLGLEKTASTVHQETSGPSAHAHLSLDLDTT